jgi:hypothetical protein
MVLRLWNICLAAIIFSLSGAASAQSTPNFAKGWVLAEGTTPAYVHQGTLFQCPVTLTDGFDLASTFTDNKINEVACAYKREEGTISFHWAQGFGSVLDEIADKERTYWAEVVPGVAPVASELTWIIGGESVKVASSQVITVAPATQKLLGISLAIGTVADRRIKANELWVGSSAVSNRVTAGFFALQTNAISNRKNCLSHGVWPARTRARLSPNPSESASTAAFFLLAQTVEPGDQQASQAAAPKICQGLFAGTGSDAASLVTQRTGVQELRAVMSNGAAGDVVAALGARPPGLTQRVDRDSPYYLYGKQGKRLAVFRSYRSLSSFPQLSADIAAVGGGMLEPIAVLSPDLDAGKIDISISDEQAAAEKAKRRPGSQ